MTRAKFRGIYDFFSRTQVRNFTLVKATPYESLNILAFALNRPW